MRRVIVIVLWMGVLNAFASADFSRYALILERRPFSSAAAAEPMAVPVTVEAPPAFVKDLRMVAITESPAGVKVGFVNIRERPPKPYYLYVGDSEDGILLVDADYDMERALLRKEGEQFWMAMGGAPPLTAAGAAPSGVPSPPPPPPAGVQRGGRPAQPPDAVPSPDEAGNSRVNSYAERRRQRIEEIRRRAEESRNLSEEEVERRLREYQMRLIREGKTPLPIPITEEMDAQLVEEGILPPVAVD